MISENAAEPLNVSSRLTNTASVASSNVTAQATMQGHERGFGLIQRNTGTARPTAKESMTKDHSPPKSPRASRGMGPIPFFRGFWQSEDEFNNKAKSEASPF